MAANHPADWYSQLLEATIRHLELFRDRGVQHVKVSPELLTELANSPKLRSTAAPANANQFKTPAPATPTAAPAPAQQKNTTPPVAAPQKPADLFQPTPLPPKTALDPQAKQAAMAELRARVEVCIKCSNLASARTQTVFGVGNIDADLMFVGEAPGADEDRLGEPFVGKAGQLLTKIIETMGLSRDQVYIGNILKCRPDTPGQRSGNRKPTTEEMATCIPYLHEQIDLIQPKVLVALGATAVEGLLGKTIGITRLRGNWREYRGIPLMPTYHPAFLLRNQSLATKREVWEDMLQVMAKLNLPISEKQRGFFLKK